MTAKPTAGQLDLFTRPPPAPAAPPKKKRKQASHWARWVGAGQCRSCRARLFLYRTRDGLRAWNQTALAAACPSCGIALTTTTVEVDTSGQKPATGAA